MKEEINFIPNPWHTRRETKRVVLKGRIPKNRDERDALMPLLSIWLESKDSSETNQNLLKRGGSVSSKNVFHYYYNFDETKALLPVYFG